MDTKSSIIYSTILKKLHIGPHRKGYTYIKDALELMDMEKYKLLKDVYIELANKYDASYNSVEACIRRSIKEGISESSKAIRIEIFGYDIDTNPRSGKNYYIASEFIPNVILYIHENNLL